MELEEDHRRPPHGRGRGLPQCGQRTPAPTNERDAAGRGPRQMDR